MKSFIRIEGMRELNRSLVRLGSTPQKFVTQSVRTASTVLLNAAKRNAPFESGDLKGGIVKKGEKSRVKGKKVYDVAMDNQKNDLFVKMTRDGKRYYYPASQEYGYITRGGGYVPGLHFLRDAANENSRAFEKRVVDLMSKKVDAALKKKG